MGDDLKLGIDISADLSKLSTSLQQAEMKVAASGQKMQRAVSLVPGIGVGNSMTSSGGISMAAPHPNNVSFSSLNAMGGNGAFPSIGPMQGPPGPPPAVRAAPRNSLFVPQGLNLAGGDGDAGAGGAGAAGASTLSAVWSRAFAGAGLTLAAGNFADNTFDLFRTKGFMNRATSGENQSHFAAQIERSLASIPLVGGLGVSLAQKLGGINYTATDEVNKSLLGTERENTMGMFGGGLEGRRRGLEFDIRQRSLQTGLMIHNRVAPDTVHAYSAGTDEVAKRGVRELNVDFQQRHLNVTTEAQKLGLQAMGLGRFGDILSVNRKIDEQLSRAEDDSPAYRKDLEKLRKASISALMMGGMSAGETIGLTGQGGALGEGSVRIGSASGQSDEIKSLLEDIARNTAKDGTAVVGRN